MSAIKRKIYSIVVICVLIFFLYLFSTIFRSSILYEHNRTIINKKEVDPALIKDIRRPSIKDSFFYDTFIQKPENLELFLRANILSVEKNTEGLIQLYSRLLKTRPTWPYYFSGLAQVNQLSKKFDSNNIKYAEKYGKYERRVVYSFSELLFYGWDWLGNKDRLSILNYLLEQPKSIISKTINISAKFARINEYCDFLYEKKQVEYAACKRNYWQPLFE